MRVYLVGFMACGKTTVGRRLARELGTPFVDLDMKIATEQGRSIPEIFEQSGEEAFRRLETQAIEDTKELAGGIFSTGGGAFIRAGNRERINELGVSVWLDVEVENLIRRLENSVQRRPLFENADQCRRLFEERKPHYRLARHRLRLQGTEPPRLTALLLRTRLASLQHASNA